MESKRASDSLIRAAFLKNDEEGGPYRKKKRKMKKKKKNKAGYTAIQSRTVWQEQ